MTKKQIEEMKIELTKKTDFIKMLCLRYFGAYDRVDTDGNMIRLNKQLASESDSLDRYRTGYEGLKKKFDLIEKQIDLMRETLK